MNTFRKFLLSSVARLPEGGGGTGGGAGGSTGGGTGGGAGGGTGGGTGGGAGGGAGGGTGGGTGGGAGGTGDPWYKPLNLDADTTKWIDEKKFGDAASVIKTARHFETVARERNVLTKPDPAKISEWEGWKDLGWEPDATKYTIKPPQVREGVIFDAAFHDNFRKAAHELRVPVATAEALFNKSWDALMAKMDAATTSGRDAIAKTQAALDTKWGPEKPRNVEMARRAAKAFGIGLEDASEVDKLLGSPRMLEVFFNASKMLGEEKLIGQGDSGGGMPSSPAAIKAELDKLESDRENRAIMNNQRHPRYEAVTSQRRALIQRLADAEARAGKAA